MDRENEIRNCYAKYKSVCKKYGISLSNILDMQRDCCNGNLKISVLHTMYEKNGNSWVKTEETPREDWDALNYLYCITAIPLFKDRVTRENTKYGNIPMKLSCLSWGDESQKSERIIKFER